MASAGCAHGISHPETTTTNSTTAILAARPDVAARAEALEAVAHRGSPAIEADGVVFSRTPAGSVRSVLSGKRVGTVPDDVALEAEIRARVARDPAMATRDVDIDVDGGVVRLSGSVPDALHAARLVDMALALPGVRAVESSLAWVSRAEVQELDDSAARAARASR